MRQFDDVTMENRNIMSCKIKLEYNFGVTAEGGLCLCAFVANTIKMIFK